MDNIPNGYDENGVRSGNGNWVDYTDEEWEQIGKQFEELQHNIYKLAGRINDAFFKGYHNAQIKRAVEMGTIDESDLKTIKENNSNLDPQEE